jgi:hypothetical protein
MRRVAHFHALITLLASWCIFWLLSPAQGDQLRERFLSEAPSGWQRIEDWNSAMECEGTLRTVAREIKIPVPPNARIPPLPQEQMTLRCRQRKDSILVQATYPDQKAKVFAINPRYSFMLEENNAPAGQPRWRVTGITNTAAPSVSPVLGGEGFDASVRGRIAEKFGLYLFPATSYASFGLWRHMVNQEGFSITKIEPLQSGGTEQLKVYCVLRFKDHLGKEYIDDVTLVFDPTNNWALTESYTQGRGRGTSIHRKVSYRSEVNAGFRPPERVVEVDTGPGGSLTEEFTFTKYERANVPDEAFTLTAFGLPEVPEAAAPPSRLLPIAALLTAAIVCALLAVLLRRRQSLAKARL